MTDILIPFLIIILSYLVGSIPTGYLLVKLIKHQDIRNFGSGNIGATNVGRLIGKTGFILTLMGDCLKAVLTIWVIHKLNQPDVVISISTIALITGHIWSIYLHFSGGKGIATALGVFLMIDFNIVLFAVTTMILLLLVMQKFTLSWLLSLIALCIFVIIQNYQLHTIYSVIISTLMIIYAHKNNIRQDIFPIKNKL